MPVNKINRECLEAHNDYRRHHGSPDLAYSEDLATGAQKWAERLANMGVLQHSPESATSLGENVAMKTSSSVDDFSGLEATEQWYSEAAAYDFNKEDQVHCGHFSQVIWKSTTMAGFGRATSRDGKVFVVGQYLPPGNYSNKWRANVGLPLDGKIRMVLPENVTDDDGDREAGGVKIGMRTKTQVVNGVKTKTVIEKFQRNDGTVYEKTTVETEGSGGARDIPQDAFRKMGLDDKTNYGRNGADEKPRDVVPLKEFVDDVLRQHNRYRTKHQVSSIQLNQDMCGTAQKWADHLAETSSFQHSRNTYQGEKMGENIACKYGSGNFVYTGSDVVDQWYSEEKDHEYGKNLTHLKSGHFSQVVWKSSKYLGVGRAIDRSGKHIVVCNYFPAGNVMGQFPENVNRAK